MKPITTLETLSQELQILLHHALGLNFFEPGSGSRGRNRLVVDPASPDGLLCQQLIDLGLLRDLGPMWGVTRVHFYTVTDAGKALVKASKK